MIKDASSFVPSHHEKALKPILHHKVVQYQTCGIVPIRAVHEVGSKVCCAPSGCCVHHGVCLPVKVTSLDLASLIGFVEVDVESIREIIKERRRLSDSRRKTLDFSEEKTDSSVFRERIELQCCDKLSSDSETTDYSSRSTLADLATSNRARRVPGPSDPPPHHTEAVKLFSELMQTDDVSTIAAQIANQADLIYQTWKTTGLNPSELIRYHSVPSDGSSTFDADRHSSTSFGSHGASAFTSPQRPRTPIRSMSPAPLGGSPAVPRKIIETPFENGTRQRSPGIAGSTQQQQQQHSYHQSGYGVQPYSSTTQVRGPQQQPYQSQQPQHASSPVRSLNTSPKPYVPPASQGSLLLSNVSSSSVGIQSPKPVVSPPSTPISIIQNSAPKPFVANSPTSFQRVRTPQPPPPPERSSSYTGNGNDSSSSPLDILTDPNLEPSLRELVNTFVLEDKARNATTLSRPKSAPSCIQDALQRFERQMAITSRIAANSNAVESKAQYSSVSYSSSSLSSVRYSQHGSNDVSYATTSACNNHSSMLGPKRYPGTRSDSGLYDQWNSRPAEQEQRSRRSISPSPPPVSQPGWNQACQSSTSTWPLKNKQPHLVDRKGSQREAAQCEPVFSTSVINSPPASSTTSYITTLETHVENSTANQQSPIIPLRHKVVTVLPVEQEEEDLIQALRTGTLIEDGDELKTLSSGTSSLPSRPLSSGNVTTITGGGNSSPTRKPKFSISVTVDVDNQKDGTDSAINSRDSPSRTVAKSESVTQMSVVDYAKVRFQDAQQFPKTAQRLEDSRSFTAKNATSDGRVMMAKTRFETTTSYIESGWRGPIPTLNADEVGSTLPEFYRRKLRKVRKAVSPEPLAALPHPELTDQQKAHIRERSQSPTSVHNAGGIAVRPFLTQGSVAERVLIFERAPGDMKSTGASPPVTPERKRAAFSTWRDPDEVRSKAQESVSSTAFASRPTEVTSTPSPTPTSDTLTQTFLRDSSSNKENAAPNVPTSPPVAPSLVPSGGLAPPTPPSLPATQIQPVRTGSRTRPAKPPKNLLIPRFYYPMGRPVSQACQDQILAQVSKCFRDQGGQITRDNMEPLMKAAQLPLYWKAPLFTASGGEKVGYLSEDQFVDYWSRVISTCHDASSRFMRILSRGSRNYLLSEDFLSLVQDVVDTHPGLTFLKEATEFHSRYVHTVIARIYYCVNRSWSGRITVPELRRSNLLQVISYLEEEEDINQITDYFSYEHFYVIYCKFWELDTDHDLFIDKHDLAKHNERALSWRLIERVFSGAVTRGQMQKQDKMGYQEFVWFLIAEEDKRHPTAIEYWFRCMDLDGDGFLSMFELEYFYEEQLQRMEAFGIETLPFKDCLCQMLDMIQPEHGDRISLSDLKKSRMTSIFFDTFFNLEKYLDHEQRDPFASHRPDEEGPELSDWDRFAAEEYEVLVAEEGGAENQDEMLPGDEDELSVVVDDALDGDLHSLGEGFVGGALSKHSPLSATVTNLAAADTMDIDDDYADYADSDDYQY